MHFVSVKKECFYLLIVKVSANDVILIKLLQLKIGSEFVHP